MIPELGNYALCLALALALIQASVPLIGAARDYPAWTALAVPVARGQVLCVALAYGCLTYAFLSNDFSVAYVANNSNTALPTIYKISGVWGAHEGSLALWILVLALWTGAVTVFNRKLPAAMLARVLAAMGVISSGFLLFMLLTSNPFTRLLPAPLEGADLNPLLQDPGLAVHPPMLYMGYVGFSVAFAFALAALMEGRMDGAWARWARPWTNIAWLFLTLGITLGSWWSYYELGWGGWWFWDPVENASFMPWLVGTALVHSLAATEKRGVFKAWTVLLAVFAFSLSLLGTFLVRSGVLTSVHAFATDPARGVFILTFLSLVVGGSLILYAWRAPRLKSTGSFELISRESGLLLNNVLLVVTAATILLGTLYPLLLDALNIGKISVGPPYFNSVFIPLTVPLALLVGFGARARWKRDRLPRLAGPVRYVLAASLAIGFAVPAFAMTRFQWGAAAGVALGAWVILTSLLGVAERAHGGASWHQRLASAPRSFYGMTLAHLGIGVFVIGVTLTTAYSTQQDVRLEPGNHYTLGGYTFQFDGVRTVAGPNYTAHRGTVEISRGGTPVATLHPEKRTYLVQRRPMTEAGIHAGLFGDLYVSLGEPLGSGAWSARLHVKPFVRWIWLGGLLMALGGGLAASDRRYRMAERRRAAALAGKRTVAST